MRFPEKEIPWMGRAIKLAKTPILTPLPNPRVGAVIIENGKIISEGFHLGPGHPHAEAMAIQKAERRGKSRFDKSEIYISLEPCCHTNKRTPPCAPLLIQKKFKKVFIACLDPNPEVSGAGVRALRKAGLDVKVGLEESRALNLIQAFIKNQKLKLPYVTLKMATTFDGAWADDFGKSKWITSELSRKRVHRERADADAIAIGARTVDTDNPSLNIRLGRKRSSRRIVIYGTPKRKLQTSKLAHANGLENILRIKSSNDLKASLKALYRDHGICHLFIEGGPTLASAFLENGLVDRILWFQGRGILGGKGRYAIGRQWRLKHLDKSIRFSPDCVEILGPDLLVQGSFRVYRSRSK